MQESHPFVVTAPVNTAAQTQKPPHVHLSASKVDGSDFDEESVNISLRAKRSSSSVNSHTVSSFDSTVPMEEGRANHKFPKERGNTLYRAIRWRKFTTYHRLFSFVAGVNLVMFGYQIYRLVRGPATSKNSYQASSEGLADMLTSTSVNLTIAITIRNEHIINMLFRFFVVYVSQSLPLRIRRFIAKVYCFGAVHSGTGLMATLWYTGFTILTAIDNISKCGPSKGFEKAILSLTGLIWSLFMAIAMTSLPTVRNRVHNCFEIIHRYGGWFLLIAFWFQTMVFCVGLGKDRHINFGQALIRVPTFWMLVWMTLLVSYPYVRAKKESVEVAKLSDHAVRFHFKSESIMLPCRVIRISDAMFKETHAFATIPEPDGKLGYSILVSNAGDWTGRLIKNPPKQLLTKGLSTWGVLRIATMFKPVVIVATGSGIGPCLGLFNGCLDLTCRVLWSAKSPEVTYGKSVVDTIRRADPDAVIIDSAIRGRMNMVQLTYNMYKDSQAEAVIVISNQNLTFEIVEKLVSRGVPAFGPIWDS